MKAFLLAGGHGERLRPFTDRMPKCLVPINGVPLLRLWLDLCAQSGIDSVLLNVNRHGAAVEEFLQREDLRIDVRVVHEQTPVGNAGTVLAHRDFVRQEENFFVLYSDNLTDANLLALVRFHQTHDGVVTMGLFRTPSPTGGGIVELDENGRVRSFIEKPERPVGNLANAGIYVCRPSVFEAIPTGLAVTDFSRNVFPALDGRIFAQLVDGYLQDIGTPEGLKKGCDDWATAHPAPFPAAADLQGVTL